MSPIMAAVHMKDPDEVIDALVKETDHTRDEIEERVEQELDELTGQKESDVEREDLRVYAVSIVKNDIKNITGGSGFGGGETEQLSILTLGYQRKEGDYFVTEGDAILGLGVVNPPDDPAGIATFVLDSDHGIDREHVADAFYPLNTVRGHAAISRVGTRDGVPTVKKGGNPTYVVNSTTKSKFNVVDPEEAPDDDPISDLPSSRDAKREMLHEHFLPDSERVNLQNYAEHVTATNDNGFEAGFGVDIKRFRGTIVDVFDNGDGFGVMTVTDDTIYDKEDIDEELVSDRMRTPGLQIWGMPPELLEYGENSVVDIYGWIGQEDDTGQYRLNASGIIPIAAFDREDDGGSSSSDDDHQEEPI